MPKQTESDFGADDAAQRLRQMLRAAFLKRSEPKNDAPARKPKRKAPQKTRKSPQK